MFHGLVVLFSLFAGGYVFNSVFKEASLPGHNATEVRFALVVYSRQDLPTKI